MGLDVGATSIKGGLVGANGEVLKKGSVPSSVEKGVEAIEERIVELLESLGGSLVPGPLGIGLPGALDLDRGVVVHSPNIPCWHGYAARDRLSAITGREVILENDANCAGIAEGWVGAARSVRSFLAVTLGTGVGGGVILDGRIWHGDSGRGGEVGHVVVDPDGMACGCGGRGCLETLASATAVMRMAREQGLAGTLQEMSDRARDHDGTQRRLFEGAGRALGIALATWLNIMDVHFIVVGGGMSAALDLMMPSIRVEIARRAYALDPERVVIRQALLGPDAGLVGAARLAMADGRICDPCR